MAILRSLASESPNLTCIRRSRRRRDAVPDPPLDRGGFANGGGALAEARKAPRRRRVRVALQPPLLHDAAVAQRRDLRRRIAVPGEDLVAVLAEEG